MQGGQRGVVVMIVRDLPRDRPFPESSDGSVFLPNVPHAFIHGDRDVARGVWCFHMGIDDLCGSGSGAG